MIQGVSLFVVLLAARSLTIIGHEAGFVAGVGPILHGVLEDAVIAASLALLDTVLRRPRFTWVIYAALALLAAFDVPVARTLGTPMTPVMLRGARVALADSILTHATPDAVLRLLAVLALALAVPLALARSWLVVTDDRRRRRVVGVSAGLAACVTAMIVAPGAAPPFHRNSVVALARPLGSAGAPMPFRVGRSSAEHGTDLRALSGAARGRNVLVVVLESTGAAPLGLHGAPGPDPMPRLTALAGDGIVFDAAYSTFPESIRSQVAYWDSRHPRVGEMPEDLATPRADPLPRLLRRAGYRTALVHSGHFDYLGMEHVVEGRGFDHLVDAGDVGGASATSFGIDEESAVAHVLEWIDAQGATPWLAAYLPIAGHHPYDTPRPGPFSGATAQSQYRNALHYADEALGRLLDGLAERGVLDETLVVITGDHGEAFGEHPGNHGHTFHLYDENVRVPLVVAMPGQAIGTRVGRVASHVDLAPTITDLLGLSTPEGWDGASLLDPASRIAHFATDWADRLVGVRDGCHKYVVSLDSGDEQLFDLTVDPLEQTNLVERLPEIAARHRARLAPSR